MSPDVCFQLFQQFGPPRDHFSTNSAEINRKFFNFNKECRGVQCGGLFKTSEYCENEQHGYAFDTFAEEIQKPF
jgi:hypothetical protein